MSHFLRKKKMLYPIITHEGNVGQTKARNNLIAHSSLRYQFYYKTGVLFLPCLSLSLLCFSQIPLLPLFLFIPFDQIPIKIYNNCAFLEDTNMVNGEETQLMLIL